MRTKFLLVTVALIAMGSALLFGLTGRQEPQSAEAAFLSEVTKLLASDIQDGDHFGFSVAISADTAIVGQCGSSDCAIPSGVGAAYVFQRDEGGTNNWGEVAKLTASDAQADDLFGFSVAVSGETAGEMLA